MKKGSTIEEAFKNVSAVYFAGIGGIGMSALARYFNESGILVSGYDKVPGALTEQMVKEGIQIHYEDDVELIDKNASLVVYTPAIPPDHRELNYFKSNNYPVVKRSEILGMITGQCFNVCIAGTHGKTTTSTMIAHILRHSGEGCTAFLGGISTNYETNFWKSDNKNICVAEADEYDRSFLKLKPDIAVITAMDPDHLDIYGTEKNMQDAFIEFGSKIKENGLLIIKDGLTRSGEFNLKNKITYSLNDTNTGAYAKNIIIQNASYRFDVVVEELVLQNVVLNMGGLHNVENAVAAIAIAVKMNIAAEKIREAVFAFKGVKRRFEYIVRERKVVMIDDYAHHPQELNALIQGVRLLYPGEKCTVVFQPHLFSRTRDLADGFGTVLSTADEVILLPIYPARELPIEGVSSELILEKITIRNKMILSKDELLSWVALNKPGLLVTAGAGDIDALVMPLKAIIEKVHNVF